MAGYNEIDPAVAARMKEAADREAARKAEQAQREAEAEGDVDVKGIVDAWDDFDGREPYRDDVAEIVANLEKEDEA